MIQNIVIIGSGNLAWHLGKVLFEAGFNIQEVVSRNIENSKVLANRVGANSIAKVEDINCSAQLYIIAVSDDSISDVCARMPDVEGVVVHTSGSIGFDPLLRFKNYGSFYPFQTFTKDKFVNFKDVQILYEGNSPNVTSLLRQIGSDISHKVLETTYEQRKQLHIAAIFASNFVNHFYSIANTFLKEKNLPFSLLLPLIEETTEKIKHIDPLLAQTGPAVRGDQTVISKHIDELKGNPDYQLIYELLSKSIQKGLF